MSNKLKGQELDKVIEKELIHMWEEGYEVSPITQANLFRRLKTKQIINSKATLTSRKELIGFYSNKQKESVQGKFGETLQSTKSMNRTDLEKANARLVQQVEDSRQKLQENTKSIVNMVKMIRLQTEVRNIERCLSVELIRELHKTQTEG